MSESHRPHNGHVSMPLGVAPCGFRGRVDAIEAREQSGGLPPGGDSAKVRKGGVGGYRQELSDEIIRALDARWSAMVTPALGFADYAELEAALRVRSTL